MSKLHHSKLILAAPARRLFGLLLPAGVDDGGDAVSYFRRAGTSYQFHSADQVGIGPALRMLPVSALLVATILGGSLIWSLVGYGDRLSPTEAAACGLLGLLVVAMIGGVSWLLRDLSQAAIIDRRNRILWLGGGWLGRWQALNFSLLARIEVIEDAPRSEYPFAVIAVDLDGDQHEVCREICRELADQAAGELRQRLDLPAPA